MLSKKTLMVVGLLFIAATFIIMVSLFSVRREIFYGPREIPVSIIGSLQAGVSGTIGFFKGLWYHYFNLTEVSKHNVLLKKKLDVYLEKDSHYKELELSNQRLRTLLKFRKQKSESYAMLAAEVIGKDPSPWFKSMVINKGRSDGIKKGMPVVIHMGIVGLVVDTTAFSSKVLLIIDQNSAVDALVQKTRARGIIRGKSAVRCYFQYVLREHNLKIGDVVVSSGFDKVYPKGMLIGVISKITREKVGIFQDVIVNPAVDFKKLEEVLVMTGLKNQK